MAKLATAVSVWEGSVLRTLCAGDEVPDWAVGRIGSHCLVSDAEPTAEAAEAVVDAPDADEVSEPKPVVDATAGPDFTKPAPKRGPGRPRKES